ncbi:MAG: hypothetical protein WEE89_06265 [Gemmatimonadota bacterium]
MKLLNFSVAVLSVLVSSCSGKVAVPPASPSEEDAKAAVQRFHQGLADADSAVLRMVASNAVLLSQGRIESARELVLSHGPTLGAVHGATGVWEIREVRIIDGVAYALTQGKSANGPVPAYGLTVWRYAQRWQLVAGHWSHL